MSEQEQDAAIGRLVREGGARKHKLTAMDAELERFKKAFHGLESALAQNVNPRFNLGVVQREVQNDPLAQFDFSKLLDFLREYSELREQIIQDEAALRGIGMFNQEGMR